MVWCSPKAGKGLHKLFKKKKKEKLSDVCAAQSQIMSFIRLSSAKKKGEKHEPLRSDTNTDCLAAEEENTPNLCQLKTY